MQTSKENQKGSVQALPMWQQDRINSRRLALTNMFRDMQAHGMLRQFKDFDDWMANKDRPKLPKVKLQPDESQLLITINSKKL